MKAAMKTKAVGMLMICLLCSCKSPTTLCDFGSADRAEEISGIWFGFAQADVYLYRIRLTSSASGDGAYSSFISERPRYLKISDWKLLGKNRLFIQFAPGS